MNLFFLSVFKEFSFLVWRFCGDFQVYKLLYFLLFFRIIPFLGFQNTDNQNENDIHLWYIFITIFTGSFLILFVFLLFCGYHKVVRAYRSSAIALNLQTVFNFKNHLISNIFLSLYWISVNLNIFQQQW